MISHIGSTRALLCAVILFAAAATASAQVVITNPRCGTVTINNPTTCTAQLNFVPVPPGWPAVVLVPAGASVVLPGPAPGAVFIINGITSFGGLFYPFNPPPPPAGVACGPTFWWINRVTLGPPPGCCFDVCIDPCLCVVNLALVPVPPPCNP